MKVLDEYKTHHYFQDYEHCSLFCPQCGVQSVWQEQGPGDYYIGEDHICVSCKHSFCIQGPSPLESNNELKKCDQLISGKIIEPSTPRGN